MYLISYSFYDDDKCIFFRDCSVSSGNCKNTWCQNTTIWRDVVFAMCSCLKGFYREVSMTCEGNKHE